MSASITSIVGATTGTAAAAPAAASRPEIKADEIMAALARVLDSVDFRKARQACRLLRFLVESKLRGKLRETAEYAIGIAVFGRDPNSYSTAEDPIVRVQAGRLRQRLASYYAGAGRDDALRIVIPLGSYMPAVERTQATQPATPPCRLTLRPFTCLSQEEGAAAFCLGLDDELAHRLFHMPCIALLPRGAGGPNASHMLEGSVRTDGQLLRVSIGLTDTIAGATLHTAQFDLQLPFGIVLQEMLARAIAERLLQQLSLSPAPAVTVTARRRNVAILPLPGARDYLVPVAVGRGASPPRQCPERRPGAGLPGDDPSAHPIVNESNHHDSASHRLCP